MIQEEKKIYKVSELNKLVKELLEEEFVQVWVEGEISNFKHHSSGHYYFDIKDAGAQLSSVMFRWQAAMLKFCPEDGMKVVVCGNLSLFVKTGRYQLIVLRMEPLGAGPLQVAFQQLLDKLKAEGLFEQSHKKPIPMLVQKMAIITSPTGAVIHDMLTIIERRFSNVQVLIYPVHVQGETAAGEVSAAIEDVNKNFPEMDVIIVGRGGGSLEDLWPFNEEIVARAIYNSALPVISAVGHEVDYTIADFVSDLRAPTPSAAIELVIVNKTALEEKLSGLISRIISSMEYSVKNYQHQLRAVVQNRIFRHPVEFCERLQQEIDYDVESIRTSLSHFFQLKNSSFRSLVDKLNILSPLNILSRGYGISWKLPENRVLKDTAEVSIGDKVRTRLQKGELVCEVIQK